MVSVLLSDGTVRVVWPNMGHIYRDYASGDDFVRDLDDSRVWVRQSAMYAARASLGAGFDEVRREQSPC